MSRYFDSRRMWLTLFLALLAAGPAIAQAPAPAETPPEPDGAPSPPANAISVDVVEAMIESAETLDDEAKAQALDQLKPALVDLQQAQAARQRIAELQAEVQNVPSRVEELRRELEAPLELPQPSSDMPPEQIEQKLDAAEASLAEANQQHQQLEGEPARRKQRLIELPQQQQQAASKAQSIRETLDNLGETTNGDPVAQARRAALQAKLQLHQAQADMARAEMRHLEATTERLQLRRDVLARRVPHLEKTVSFWRKQAAEASSAQTLEIVQAVRQQQQQLADAPAAVRELAAENLELAAPLKGGEALPKRIDRTRRTLARRRQQLTRLTARRSEIERRIDIVGLNESVGMLLRQQRTELPDPEALTAELENVQQRLVEARMTSLELENRRADLADTQARAEEILADLPSEQARAISRDNLVAVLEQRKKVLAELVGSYDTLGQELSELQQALAELRDEAQEFGGYIDERVLWIRSAEPMKLETLGRAGLGLRAMLAPSRWGEVLQAMWRGSVGSLLPLAGWLLAIVALAVRRRWGRRRFDELAEQAQPRHGRAFLATLRAAGWTVYLSLLWPVVLWAVADLMGRSPEASAFAREVAGIVGSLAGVLLALTLLGQLAARAGLLASHLRWKSSRVASLRGGVRAAMWCIVPTAFLARLAGQFDGGDWQASLGRLGTMAVMLEVTVLAAWLARPGGPWLHRESDGPARLLRRYRWVLFVLAAGVPLLLLLLAAVGYLYTVEQLLRILRRELWLVLAAMIAYPLLMRGVFLVRRDMARRRITEQRQAEAAGEKDETVADQQLRQSLEEVSATSASIGRLVALLTGVLLVVGTLAIFREVLPALSVLDRITLWGIEGNEPVSLRDLLGGVLTLIFVIYASRSLPGLLDTFVLQRVGMDTGKRYALTTVARYILIAMGVMIVAEFLGVRWENLQWIVAALGVGLGFGLQEIFANFVSGLILLAERPVRVGDLVTVGQVTGKVSRIQIRATTVVDFDRKELIIPNKEFVTGQLINWSLSDRKARVVIPVGVAYGSNTDLAQRTLMEVARAHAAVLDDPEPTAYFLGFGDSSLDFQLRVFIGDTDQLFSVRHELHMAIDAAFRKAGITIAFPQRDVHMFFDDREAIDRLAGRNPSKPKE
jgi:potassium efflux system protein